MSEKSENLEQQLQDAAKESHLWKTLFEHPGWVAFEKLIEAQVNIRQRTILLTPLASNAQVFQQEYMKGEAAGAQLALALARSQLEQAELNRVRLTNELEREHEIEERIPADGGSRVDVGEREWFTE